MSRFQRKFKKADNLIAMVTGVDTSNPGEADAEPSKAEITPESRPTQ